MKDGIGKPLYFPTGNPATCDGMPDDCPRCPFSTCAAVDLVCEVDDFEDEGPENWTGHLMDWTDVPGGRFPL